MIIDVRPAPTTRRHRARVAGAVAAVALVAASFGAVATLAQDARPEQQRAPYSDPITP
ncbi:MAG: hypothetical protein H6529_11355 [Nocardioides sp.]|nr:hypothetical protein [Nocardioides sp.]